jgi:predicted nucleotidyltransferase
MRAEWLGELYKKVYKNTLDITQRLGYNQIMENNVPQKDREDIENATIVLKNEGGQSLYLFGSLVTGNNHDGSDIDIGIKGLPPEKFFRVYAKLDNNLSNDVDLVDFDENNKFYNLLNSLGEVIEIG